LLPFAFVGVSAIVGVLHQQHHTNNTNHHKIPLLREIRGVFPKLNHYKKEKQPSFLEKNLQ